MWKIIVREIRSLINELTCLDKKVITIFLTVAVLQTISFYFSSPKFFRANFYYQYFDVNTLAEFYEYVYWFVFDFIIYLIIPVLVIKFLLKENISHYGLKLGEAKIGFALTIFTILIFIPVIYFIADSEIFSEYFPLYQEATDELRIFIVYELLFILFLFAWEFIFRGFMLFGLEEKFGWYSVFIQMIPFVILHNGKPFVETFASIFGAIFLGYLALRTRSIIYGFFIHAFILLSLDIIAYIKS